MSNVPYKDLTEEQQLEYNFHYIQAIKNNDLETIKHLTSLGTPIAYTHGSECSSLQMLFNFENKKFINDRAELIGYIFEHGICHPKSEDETGIVLYYSFSEQHESLISLLIDKYDFNKPLMNKVILGVSIAALLFLKENGQPQYWEQWKSKDFPEFLETTHDLVSIFEGQHTEVFSIQIMQHLDHLENFIELQGFSKRLVKGCYNSSDNEPYNIMGLCLIEHINNLPLDKFNKVIENLDKQIKQKSSETLNDLKSLISYNRLNSTIDQKVEQKTKAKHKI